ncbi:MAG: hypothetical protein ACREIP_06000 [Alphaproteobacteria bacterium]
MNASQRQAMNVAQAAIKIVAANDKGSIPPPNDRDPRRITAHLGEFKVEGEFPPQRADSYLMIDYRGALVLKAHIVPIWDNNARTDEIELTEVRSTDWFADFLNLASGPSDPKAAPARRSGRAKPKKGNKRPTAQRKSRTRPKQRKKAAKRTRKAAKRTRR